MIFDTDVLIWAERGHQSAANVINEAPLRYLSVQSYMELLQGSQDKRQLRLRKQVVSDMHFLVLPLTEAIGNRAALYVEDYALNRGLRVGDALIAAPAIENSMPLITSNMKHFRHIPDLDVRAFEVI